MAERPHVPALDGVRGTAIFLVFVYHYAGGAQSSSAVMRLIGNITRTGWTGVSLFFVLSGFLITGILWDSIGQPRWWRKFYIRRTLRIFPLYYLTILLVVLVAVFQGRLRYYLHTIGIFALYLQNLGRFPDPNGQLRTIHLKLYHFWSLATEEQFYLVWPWLLYLVHSRRRAAKWMCASIFVLSFVYRFMIAHYARDPMAFWGTTFARSGEFAAGGWLALVLRGPAEEQNRVIRFAAPVCLVTLAGFCALAVARGPNTGVPNYVWGLVFTAPFFAGIVALCYRPNPVQRVMSTGWLRWLGGISYGLYIYHILFSEGYHAIASYLAGRLSGGRNMVLGLNFAVAAVLSVSLAWLSYRYIESPFLKLKNKWAPVSSRVVSKAPTGG